MSNWLAITAAAAIFAVTPLQRLPNSAAASTPDAREQDEAELLLATARVRFLRTLAQHHYDRADPAVAQTGRELTAQILPLLALRGAIHGVATETLGDIASDALGAYFASIDPAREAVLAVRYLRVHDDTELSARFVATATGSLVPSNLVLADIAEHGRRSIAPAVATAIARGDGERDRLCRGALHLPDDVRAPVVNALVASLPSEPSEDIGPACAVLASQSRAGRALLARWIDAAIATGDTVRGLWFLAASFALAGGEQRAASDRGLEDIDARSHRFSRATAEELVTPVAPFLPLASPALRPFFVRSAVVRRPLVDALALGRVAAGDTTVVADILRTRPPASGDNTMLRFAIVFARDADVPSVLARLTQPATVGMGLVDAAAVREGLDAIRVVEACRGRTECLVDRVAHGTQLAAARAVRVLGPRGLAALDTAAADVLIRRLLEPDPGPVMLAFAATVHGCPARLRGAMDATLPAAEARMSPRPAFARFVAACGASR